MMVLVVKASVTAKWLDGLGGGRGGGGVEEEWKGLGCIHRDWKVKTAISCLPILRMPQKVKRMSLYDYSKPVYLPSYLKYAIDF